MASDIIFQVVIFIFSGSDSYFFLGSHSYFFPLVILKLPFFGSDWTPRIWNLAAPLINDYRVIYI